MDDVLVFGSNQTEHDQQLITILEQIKAAGVTLNRDKCKFSVHVVKILNKADPWSQLLLEGTP